MNLEFFAKCKKKLITSGYEFLEDHMYDFETHDFKTFHTSVSVTEKICDSEQCGYLSVPKEIYLSKETLLKFFDPEQISIPVEFVDQYELETIHDYAEYTYLLEDVKFHIHDFIVDCDEMSSTEKLLLDMTQEEKNEVIKWVAARYAYDKKYDCNLGYWDNIHSLLVEALDPVILKEILNKGE